LNLIFVRKRKRVMSVATDFFIYNKLKEKRRQERKATIFAQIKIFSIRRLKIVISTIIAYLRRDQIFIANDHFTFPDKREIRMRRRMMIEEKDISRNEEITKMSDFVPTTYKLFLDKLAKLRQWLKLSS
jgi:hypothetical protein